MDRNTTFDNKISVIIPAYNEAKGINRTIRHIRESAGERSVEVVVADGGPGHETLAAVEDDTVVRVECPQGRGVQMNAGAAMSSGGILVFLHADTRLPAGWPAMIEGALVDGVRAGAFSLSMDSDRFSLAVVSFHANLRSRWERVPYGDQAHFLQADFFWELGGYAGIPIMEDVDLFLRIRQNGERIAVLREKVKTSPRRFETDGVLRRILSNWWLRIRYAFGVSPRRLVRDYKPHGEQD